MRLRNVKNKDEILDSNELVIRDSFKYKGNWKEVFSNDNPICIEIGMGKGDFIVEMARLYPSVNFIGIEKYSSILALAIKKISEPLPNLRFIRMDALEISDIFHKEVDKIFLNFSDPWPKKRHAHRRLTSHLFLEKYDELFVSEKQIHQKTDNMELFEFSIESLSSYGYIIEKISLDLHNSDVMDNVFTEYERKFSTKNNKIYFLLAKK